MKKIGFVIGLLVLPNITFAQATINSFLINVVAFIDTVIIPFMFGVAFLVFVINAIRYFVVQSNNEEGREKAKALISYSLLAFVLLIVFWGIINLLVSSLGLECDNYEKKRATSDYVMEYMPSGPTVTICP